MPGLPRWQELIEDRWVIAAQTYQSQSWLRSWLSRNCGEVPQVSRRRMGDYGGRN